MDAVGHRCHWPVRLRNVRPHRCEHFACDLSMDAVWCGTVLFCKPLLFVHEARLEPSLAAYGLRAITAAALPVVALPLPRRIRVWTLTATAILGSAIVLGDILYYGFFGDVLSVADMVASFLRIWRAERERHPEVTL